MENNDLYNKYQAGFKPDHRTTYHIFIIKILVNKYIHKFLNDQKYQGDHL
jgi:hypothetical protein